MAARHVPFTIGHVVGGVHHMGLQTHPEVYGAIHGWLAAARVSVAPLLRLVVPRTPRELKGVMRPAISGAAVAIQRLQGTTWTTVATAPVDASGAFDAQLQLIAGTYRARVAPGHGLVPGVSPVLLVSVS